MKPSRRRSHWANFASFVFVSLLSSLMPLTANGQSLAETPPGLDVPFVPTPQEVVDAMLKLANVSKEDRLIDLGSGDGRIVITAAKEYGTTGTGYDLNPERIAEAQANAKKAGVTDKVEFKEQDLFTVDLSDADVVTLYLLPSVNKKLRPQLWKQLKVGSRVVSHAFDMGSEWPPEKTETVDGKTIYYWTITKEHKAQAKELASVSVGA